MARQTVEVLAVVPVTNVKTGAAMHQVAFGEALTMNKVIRDRIRATGQPIQGDHVTLNALVLNFTFNGVVPYKIGEKWHLEVNEETGELSVKPVTVQ